MDDLGGFFVKVALFPSLPFELVRRVSWERPSFGVFLSEFLVNIGPPANNCPCRVLKDTTPLQRGIIRHLVLIIDFSLAMSEKDLRPTRHLLTLRYTQEFVTEYFEQNPISQLGIIGMRDGLAVRVSDMSGNPNDHIAALQTFREQDPKGNPSLQNALEMARGALLYVPPSHWPSL